MQNKSSSLIKDSTIPFIIFHQNEDSYKYLLKLKTILYKGLELTVNADAIDFIKTIPSPLAIIGIAGVYRTGKSFLLNRMLINKSSGFQVGSTIAACTKGILIYTTPLKGKTINGQDVNILIIDSEGLGSIEKDIQHDSKLFSLIMLLSSCFIYNSMGSIDEQAISNLSLIVNLSKNIQIKRQILKILYYLINSIQSEDSDQVMGDYAPYFPQFYWVIRDFSLQLVDLYDNPITSNQYLENALKEQEGQAEQIEEKNRIRRSLVSLFPERDCFTFVRPLLNEQNLQNLSKMEMTQLRQEFQGQVHRMRQKIFNTIRVKQINGINLNGEMYIKMVESYIETINQGLIPNIETSWIYLCKDQCSMKQQKCEDMYEEKLLQLIQEYLPCKNDKLQQYHNQVKKDILKYFKENAYGDHDIICEYEKELKIGKLKYNLKRSNYYSNCNIYKLQIKCNEFMKNEFYAIQEKLLNNGYKKFSDFEKDLLLFEKFLIDHGPQTQNNSLYFADFIKKQLINGVHLFNTYQEQKIENEQKQFQTKLENENQKYNQLQLKNQELQQNYSSIEGQNLSLQQSVKILQEQKNNIELQFSNQLASQQEENQQYQNQFFQNQDKMQEQIKYYEREILKYNSQLDKEKLLYSQKQKYNEEQIEFYKDQQAKLQNEISQLNNELATINSVYQQKINQRSPQSDHLVAQLEKQIQNLQDQLHEYQIQLYQKQRLEEENEIIKEQNRQLEIKMQKALDEITELKENNQAYKIEENESYYKYEDAMRQKEQMEKLISQREKLEKQMQNQFEQEKALIVQQLDFTKAKYESAKKQLNEVNLRYEQTIQTLQQFEQRQKLDQENLIKLKQTHSQQLKDMEILLQQNKQQHLSVQESLKQNLNNQNLQLTLEMNTLKNELYEIRQLNLKLQTQLDQGKEQLKTQEIFFKQELQNQGNVITKLHTIHEEEMDELKHQHQIQIQFFHQKQEENIFQLKKVYEQDKELFRQQLSDQKILKSNLGQFSFMEQELIELRQELINSQSENEYLQKQLEDFGKERENFEVNAQQDIQLKEQLFNNIDQLLQGANDFLEFQFSKQQFQEQQYSLIIKIQDLINQRNDLHEMNQALEQKSLNEKFLLQNQQQVQEQLQQKDNYIEQIENQLNEEINSQKSKILQLEQKLQNLNEKNYNESKQFEKENAILKQQNQFLTEKMAQMEQQFITDCTNLEQNLSVQIQQKLNATSQNTQQLNEQVNLLKKQLQFSKTNEDRLQNENIKYLNDKDNMNIKLQQYNLQVQEQLNTIQQLQEKLSNLEHNMSKNEVNDNNVISKQKQKIDELEAILDKERVLWEGKVKFLENQKNQAKEDLQDSLQKFEMTLQHLKTARQNQNKANDESIQEMVLTLEKKHQSEAEEIKDCYERQIIEQKEKYFYLQQDMKLQNEKYQIQIIQLNDKVRSLDIQLRKGLSYDKRTYTDQITSNNRPLLTESIDTSQIYQQSPTRSRSTKNTQSRLSFLSQSQQQQINQKQDSNIYSFLKYK